MTPQESWLERAAPLTGVAFVVLGIVGGLLAYTGPDFLGPPPEIVAHYEENPGRVQAGAALAIWAVPFLLWFLGSLYRALREEEGDRGRLSVVAFGGGAAGAAVLLVAGTAALAAGARAGEEGTIGADLATGLFDVGGFLYGAAAPLAFSVTVGATALLVLRTGAFAPWFGWASAVLAVALFALPISWAAFPAFFAWVLIVSLWLYAGRVRPEVPAAAPAGPAR